MAEPLTRAVRKRRSGRALQLMGAILAIVLGGLFVARTANAAPVTTAVPVAKAAPAAAAAPAANTAPAAETETSATTSPATTTKLTAHIARNQEAALMSPTALDSGICNVPGVGDIGNLIGLCQTGSGVVGQLNNICTSGPPEP